MSRLIVLGVDLVAVAVLVFGLYFPRHRRRDLVAAYLGVIHEGAGPVKSLG